MKYFHNRSRWIMEWLFVPTAIYAVYFYLRLPDPLHAVFISHGLWHLLPVDALSGHPVQSLWYLHSQPPMLNLLFLAALKLEAWTSLSQHEWASIFMIAISWGACVVWFGVSRGLLRSFRLACLVEILLVSNPGFDFYQRQFFYPHLLMLETGLVAWGALRFGARPTRRRGLVLALAYGVMAYTWALWHPAFGAILALLAGVHCLRRSGNIRLATQQTLVVFGFFMALAAPWMIKNKILVKEAGFSSWLGLNFKHLGLGPNEIWDFATKGTFDAKAVQNYYGKNDMERLRNIPALSSPFKPRESPVAPLDINLNFYAVPALSKLALARTIGEYKQQPREILHMLVSNAFFYSLPAATVIYSYDSKAGTYRFPNDGPYARWHDRLYYGGWLIPMTRFELHWTSVGLNLYAIFWFPLVLAGGLLRLRGIGRARGLAWGVLFAMVVWLFIVVTIIDGAEGARMRWHLEPAFLLLAIQTLREIFGAIRRKFARRQLSREPASAVLG